LLIVFRERFKLPDILNAYYEKMKDIKSDEKGHEHFMKICIDLALEAKTKGDSPVGSVLVKDGAIVGRGVEAGKSKRDITFHAEIEAIRDANDFLGDQDLSSCILYSTHEPCIMCSYVIRHAKIHTVVIGIPTVETGGVHSFYPILTDTKIKKWGKPPRIIKGILERDIKLKL
jgi:tRNA(adenine34) deaminase